MAAPYEGRFSSFIRQRREQLGITQQRLASMIDVSADHIALVESGHLPLDIHKLYLLADALAINETYLSLMRLVEDCPAMTHNFWNQVLSDIAKAGAA
jgi:transcriptional regulator with XRE-family HTH domain